MLDTASPGRGNVEGLAAAEGIEGARDPHAHGEAALTIDLATPIFSWNRISTISPASNPVPETVTSVPDGPSP